MVIARAVDQPRKADRSDALYPRVLIGKEGSRAGICLERAGPLRVLPGAILSRRPERKHPRCVRNVICDILRRLVGRIHLGVRGSS